MKRIISLIAFLSLALPAEAQEKDWQKQWNQMLAEARKEGKVVVQGSADPVVRKELPEKFQARFGIPLEYLGGRGADNFSRLSMERQAGVYTTDAVTAGMSNMVDYYQQKFLDPLKPALILPEVVDLSKWKAGKLWFMDPEERYILRLYNYVSSGLIFINTQQVKPQDFKSIHELLNPKWRGKISVYDPRVSGTGEVEATRFYLKFGPDFVKKLYVDQKPVISRDKRQLADWLARGTYPVSVSAETEFILAMKNQGLPVEAIAPDDAPGTLTAGNGLLGLISKAAHPNAARIFVNWITSKEGMEIFGNARKKPTTRKDVDESYTLSWEVPKPGLNYVDAYTWEFTETLRTKTNAMMKDLLKGR